LLLSVFFCDVAAVATAMVMVERSSEKARSRKIGASVLAKRPVASTFVREN
jgi:hypothetical protein